MESGLHLHIFTIESILNRYYLGQFGYKAKDKQSVANRIEEDSSNIDLFEFYRNGVIMLIIVWSLSTLIIMIEIYAYKIKNHNLS